MVEYRDQCGLRIAGVADVERARSVLGSVAGIAADLAPGTNAVAFVSEVADTPAGPVVFLDGKGLGRADFEFLIEALGRAAERAGLEGGTLEVPVSARLADALEALGFSVVGAVLPPPDPRTGVAPVGVPARWLEVGAGWPRASGLAPLVVDVMGAEAEVGWPAIGAWLAMASGRAFRVACGSVEGGMRMMACVEDPHPRVVFMASGHGWSARRFGDEAEAVREVVEGCAAEAAYGYVTPVPRARRVGRGAYDLPGKSHPGLASRALSDVSDVGALDAFWYQVLGPGHLARTGPLPDARPLGGGRVGVTIGDFDGWSAEVRREVEGPVPGPLRARGRSMLEACFLTREEARALRRSRRGRAS